MAGTASPTTTRATGNAIVDALLWGAHWTSGGGTAVISTWIAGQPDGQWVGDGYGGQVWAFAPSAAELAALASATAAFEAVCNIDFRPVQGAADADLVWASVGDADAFGGLGWTNPPGTGSAFGDSQSMIAMNRDMYQTGSGDGSLLPGSMDHATLLHQLGLSVGLGHPHDGAVTLPGVEAWSGDLGDFDLNQGVFTSMSLNGGWQTAPHGTSPSPFWGFQAGPMALDIAALQALYGANMTHRTGHDTYLLPSANQAGTGWTCLWDAGGSDRIRGAATLPNVIDLRAATLRAEPGGGGFVSYAAGIHGGVTIAHGTVIEKGFGGNLDDHLTGNGADNHLGGLKGNDILLGLAGNDALDGGPGDDWMEGGEGHDTYWVTSPGDRVIEAPGGGADQVRSFIPYTLPSEVEKLRLMGSGAIAGTGNELPNWILGNAADNVILGLAGNDTLEGAGGDDTLDGGPGGDRMRGGAGDDLYIVDSTGDSTVESPDAGVDEVRASVSVVLATNVENLLLTGSLATSGRGNAIANVLVGNGAGNLLQGLSGDDRLTGGGGNDTLQGGYDADLLDGGEGDDLLQGDSGRDHLVGGAGSDAFRFLGPSEGGDVIADFSGAAGERDRIEISVAGFRGGLAAGATLRESQFVARDDNLAQEADDRFVFRTSDRTLWYDSNGHASGGLSLVAYLQEGATISHADILLVA